MADIIQPSDDLSVVPAENETAQPIVIRRLDRLETTRQSSNASG